MNATPRTCPRCKGTGSVRNPFQGGRCFLCDGTGTYRPAPAATAQDQRDIPVEVAYGMACQMNRAHDRAARRAARGV